MSYVFQWFFVRLVFCLLRQNKLRLLVGTRCLKVVNCCLHKSSGLIKIYLLKLINNGGNRRNLSYIIFCICKTKGSNTFWTDKWFKNQTNKVLNRVQNNAEITIGKLEIHIELKKCYYSKLFFSIPPLTSISISKGGHSPKPRQTQGLDAPPPPTLNLFVRFHFDYPEIEYHHQRRKLTWNVDWYNL